MWSRRSGFGPGADMSECRSPVAPTRSHRRIDKQSISARNNHFVRKNLPVGTILLLNRPIGVFETPGFRAKARSRSRRSHGAIGGDDHYRRRRLGNSGQTGRARRENDVYFHRRRRNAGIARRQRASRRGRAHAIQALTKSRIGVSRSPAKFDSFARSMRNRKSSQRCLSSRVERGISRVTNDLPPPRKIGRFFPSLGMTIE